MNKDQVRGVLKDMAGKLQEQTGKLFGSLELQRKGVCKQIEGQAQKSVGDVDEVLKGLTQK